MALRSLTPVASGIGALLGLLYGTYHMLDVGLDWAAGADQRWRIVSSLLGSAVIGALIGRVLVTAFRSRKLHR
jgi:hypothetical protein